MKPTVSCNISRIQKVFLFYQANFELFTLIFAMIVDVKNGGYFDLPLIVLKIIFEQ